VGIHTPFLTATRGCHASILTATRGLPQTHPVSLSLSLFLSNCHCKTCHVNLYQKPVTTCTKQPVPTICNNNLINQTRSNHQDQSPKQLSTICTISPGCASNKTTHNNSQPSPTHASTKHVPITTKYQPIPQQVHQPCTRTYSKLTNKGPLAIHHTIHKLKTINPYIKPCAKTSLLYSLKHVPLISQSYTKTTNKFLSQCTTRYANKTKLNAPTMCLNRSASNHTSTTDTIHPRGHKPNLTKSCLKHAPQHH
jgi:hypothetical protein